MTLSHLIQHVEQISFLFFSSNLGTLPIIWAHCQFAMALNAVASAIERPEWPHFYTYICNRKYLVISIFLFIYHHIVFYQ
jgi:hypothetical protein